jgi:hypothetical protein
MSNNGGKKIGIDRAKKMIANYQSQADANATQSVWFSADSLAAALGLSIPAGHAISGLRFYFAAYDPSMSDAGEAAKNQQATLVFTPTTQEGDRQVSQALEADPGTADEDDVYNEGQLCPPFC